MLTKNRTKIAIASGVVLPLLLGVAYACGVREYRATSELRMQSSETVQMDRPTAEPKPKVVGELAKYYETINELVADSDVIALGRFEGNPRVTPPREAPNVAPSSSEDAPPPARDPKTRLQLLSQRGPGYRELTFRPTQILKGDVTTVASTLSVAQIVGISGNTVTAVEDDPLFELGTTYILFLKPASSQEGQYYWITGAFQGTFLVNNGKVYSRNVIKKPQQGVGEPQRSVGPRVEGQSLDSFLTTIREKVNK